MIVDFYATELQKAKDFIKQGYPLLAEVDFNPATDSADMHFVLLAGVSENNELLVVDPWEGQWETWSDGASRRNIYQFRKYDKKCLTGEDTDSLLVKKTDFERLVRNSSLYDWIISKDGLSITDSETTVKENIRMLKTVEDRVAQLEREKNDMTSKAEALEVKLEKTAQDLKEALDHNVVLSTEIGKDQKTIQSLTSTVEGLQKSLQELKDQSTKPIEKPWYIQVLELFRK
jgi:hypothetical protein